MQMIPHEGGRVETGTVQFGDDWPGVFIRGDNAFALAMPLQALLDGRDDPLTRAQVGGLLSLLRSSNVHADTRHPTPAADEVEAVARAIHEKRMPGYNPDCLYEHREHENWPVDDRREYADPITGEPRVQVFHKAWRHYESAARAAIAAMQARSAEPRYKPNRGERPETLRDDGKCGMCGGKGRIEVTTYANAPDAGYAPCPMGCPAEPDANLAAAIAKTGERIADAVKDAPRIKASLRPAEPAGDEPVAEVVSYRAIELVASVKVLPNTNGLMPFDVGDKLYARPATPTNPERLVGDGAFTRDAYALEWIAGARPPVHPNPMKGARSFPSFERALHFFRSQADDAEIVSLRQHRTTEFDRTDELRAALSAAPSTGSPAHDP